MKYSLVLVLIVGLFMTGCSTVGDGVLDPLEAAGISAITQRVIMVEPSIKQPLINITTQALNADVDDLKGFVDNRTTSLTQLEKDMINSIFDAFLPQVYVELDKLDSDGKRRKLIHDIFLAVHRGAVS